MRGNTHARCGVGEKMETISKFYLSLFNKSHAAAYAAISMQTAYLKANYPHEFAVGLLTSVMDDSDKLMKYVASFRSKGITILPPDVTKSEYGFSIEDEDKIRFGLFAVKGVGVDTAKTIPEERKKGEYKDYIDFITRNLDFNKTAFENLAKCGACDSFGYTRRTLCENVDKLVSDIKREERNRDESQMTLFDFGIIEAKSRHELKEFPEYSFIQLYRCEKEASGMYISGHPAKCIDKLAKEHGAVNVCDITCEDFLCKSGDVVSVAGVITKISKKITRNGNPMMIIDIEDESGSISGFMFEKTIQQYAAEIDDDALVFATGKVKGEGEDASIIIDSIHVLHDTPKVLWIGTDDSSLCNLRKKAELFRDDNKGFGDYLYIVSKTTKNIEDVGRITLSDDALVKARITFGVNNVKVTDKKQ